ncbi:hypothetical protein [Actinomadura rubrisoli]|uniref:Lipoprotein n=1 Tax=Actinomadura rubrisoli TaxID=2530368 RepID=A0A4R5CDB2_9ACTN|nr:hypothetical protein [Actinomadura rubrisoli]TDD96846.1 hypothetical protein E1298_02375 [Actinomadura rubrisoli]
MRIPTTATLAVPAALMLMFAAACDSKEDGASVAAGSSGPSAPSVPSANGVERLDAAKILARARKATLAARSVRLHGTIRDDDGKDVTLDFRYSGGKAMGDLTTDGQRVSLVRIGRAVYFKGDDAFWKAAGGKGAVQLLSGKYLKTTPNEKDFAELAAFTIPSKLFAQLLTPEGALSKRGAATVAGVPATSLADGGGGRLYVATRGEPHVLRIESKGDGRVDFDGYGAAVAIQPPPAGQVVDVADLNP